MKKLLGVVIVLAMTGLVMHATATQILWNGGTDLQFSTAANWVGGAVPRSLDEAKTKTAMADLIVIDSDQTITKLTGGSRNGGGYKIDSGTLTVSSVYADGNTANANCLTVINGGTFDVQGVSKIGLGGDTDAGTSTVQLKSGAFNSAGAVTLGHESNGNLEISGGTATFSSYLWLGGDGGTDTRNGNGVLSLSGDGALNVLSSDVVVGKRLGEGMFTMADSSSAVFFNLAIGDVSVVGQEGTGAMNLLGGTLNVTGNFAVDNGSVLIDSGTLVWDGDHVADFSTLVAAGDISCANGQAMLYDTWDASWVDGESTLYAYEDAIETGGDTIIWASPVPEPTTMGLFVVSGLILAIHRRMA